MSKRMSPCQQACPTKTNVAKYTRLILEGDLYEAWKVNRAANVLVSVCGRVCVHPCESSCKRGNIKSEDSAPVSLEPVAIRGLKRFITDYLPPDYQERFLEEILPIKKNNKRVAVVGSGPAGLAVANDLILSGCEVVIFESLPEPGGTLRFGIPSYRLPREVLEEEIGLLGKLGVKIITNTTVGKNISLDALERDFNAVFVGPGAQKPKALSIKGENLAGVIPGITFLQQVSLGEPVDVKGKVMAVIGGGFTAADVARTALRMGAKVIVLYRRGLEEMPMDAEERRALVEEGVKVHCLASPLEILSGRGKKGKGLRCIKNELTEPDASGRRKPVPIPGSEFELEADMVIPAIDQEPDTSLLQGVSEANPETLETPKKGIFAGGDFITGTSNVIEVIAHAHRASEAILKYLGEEMRNMEEDVPRRIAGSPWNSRDPETMYRQKTYGGWLKEGGNFKEVDKGLTRDIAIMEASRCLQCDYVLEIEKDCNYCGACVRNCPQNALEMTFLNKDPNRFKENRGGQSWFYSGHWHIEEDAQITRNPDLCIQCGVCVQSCPVQNMSFLSK